MHDAFVLPNENFSATFESGNIARNKSRESSAERIDAWLFTIFKQYKISARLTWLSFKYDDILKPLALLVEGASTDVDVPAVDVLLSCTGGWLQASLTFPWLFPFSLTFPWPLWNSLTFPGFPGEWSPCKCAFSRKKVEKQSYVTLCLILSM